MKPTLLYNAHFVALQKRTHNITAVLLNNGIIEKTFIVGKKLPTAMKKIDLKGNYVIPGFIDSHTHLISRGLELQRIDLGKCTSLSECLEKLRAAVQRDDDLAFGSNWDEFMWPHGEKNHLMKETLDKISKKKPVIMRRVCGHFAVVNTKALECIPRQWKIVDRKNGFLYENVVDNLNEIFKSSKGMLEKAIDLATAEAHSHGITTVHEIATPERFRLLQELKRQGRLRLRFAVYIPREYLHEVASLGLSSGLGDDVLKFAGIKIYVDGAIGAQTAALSRPYEHTNNKGMLLITTQRLRNIAEIAEDNGIQLMIHSIGDRATHAVMKTLERSLDKKSYLRHRLEHIELVDDYSIDAMARLNVIASMQPNFVRRWQTPGSMYERYVGTRYKDMNCFKKLLSKGVRVIFGSDCMPIGPLYGIEGVVHHPSITGRLDPGEAMRCYTTAPAYATFDEDKKGMIETGKLGDLVVLDKNPLQEKSLCEAKIVMVFVDGELVYKKNE